jgi:hypothetical protein
MVAVCVAALYEETMRELSDLIVGDWVPVCLGRSDGLFRRGFAWFRSSLGRGG